MRFRVHLLIALMLLAAPSFAYDFTATGVGGGGWLHGGTFHPTDTDVILVGADVSGVYRTDDCGASWHPWNSGLPNHEELYTQYVDDLLGMQYNGAVYYYAATFGGLYRAPDSGGWSAQTPTSSFCYRDTRDVNNHADAIPFCCLDDDGAGYLVAGAGKSRLGEASYETGSYPGLPSGSIALWGVDGQYTVWSCDLSQGTTWTPDNSTTFGAARDISVANIGGQRYIAVAARNGVYLKKPGQSWIQFNTVVEDSLDCWSVHLTSRGTLYTAFRRAITNPNVSLRRPTGVYRIFDVTSADSNTPFTLVCDGTQLQPSNYTILDYGRSGDLMFLAVADGTGSGEQATPDRLFLGSVTSSQGMFRADQAYSAQNGCTWVHLTWYNNTSPYHWFWDLTANPPAAAAMDPGWASFGWSNIIFHPVVSKADPDYVLIHNNTRLHTSTNGGDSWVQRYVTGSASGWTSRGYNELCVEGLDFMPDGRVVEGTADCGMFLATDSNNTAFQWTQPQANYYTTSTSDVSWSNEAGRVHVRDDWNGGGDAIFVIFGDVMQRGTPTKLFMYRNSTWTNITSSLADLDRHIFRDFAFGNDNTCYVIYTKYNGKVGTTYQEGDEEVPVRPVEAGVYKGVYSGGTWSWTAVNTGLNDDDPGVNFNRFGDAIVYNPYSNRVMLAAGYIGVRLVGGASITVHGGLFYLDGLSDTSWSACFSGHSADYRDFKSIGLSNGAFMYVGTRGRSGSGIGTVLKCTNPRSTPMTWTALANTSASDIPFGFQTPFWASTSYGYPANWDQFTTNKYFTDVRSIVIDPNNANTIYVGLQGTNFMQKEGLWRLLNGTTWQHLSANELFVGMTVRQLAIKGRDTTTLFVGTDGQELYKLSWYNGEPPPDPQDPGEGGLGLRILQKERGDHPLTIRFTLTRNAPVELKVFDVRGRLVKRFDAGELPAGLHTMSWDGRDGGARKAAAGVYLARLKAGEVEATTKMLLLSQ